MKQKVLITGASGFVGFHLIEAALAKGLEVHAAVRKSSDIAHLKHNDIRFTYPHFADVDSLKKELDEHRYNFIIHAAGVTKARTQDDYNNVNALYTANLAKAVKEGDSSLQKMVLMSSLAAIGPLHRHGLLINESTAPSPVTAYGKSKLLAEKLLEETGIPAIVLRPTAVYGPRERDIFIILKTLKRGLEPYIGRTGQELSFVYVKDLAEVTVNALFAKNNGAYNITDGHCYDRYQLAVITKQLLGKKTFRLHLPQPMVKGLALLMEKSYGLLNKTPALNMEKLNELTAINWCCNIEKAKEELGFAPKYNLEQGLKESVEWYQVNKWL